MGLVLPTEESAVKSSFSPLRLLTMALVSLTMAWPAAAQSIRIKEIAAVQGVRSNS